MAQGPVWFDFENTPHVLFLEPIIKRLQSAGVETIATAKPQSQTVAVAASRGLDFEVVGGGDHKGHLKKLLFGLGRAAQLASWALSRKKPRLLVSSSRTACVAARSLGIPAIGLLDYEHAEHRPIALASKPVMMPDLFLNAELPASLSRVVGYFEGLKENLYIDDRGLDRDACRATLGIDSGDYVIVARPPAWNAHYAERVDDSAKLWLQVLRDFNSMDHTKIYLVPRDREQFEWIHGLFDGTPRMHPFPEVMDGPALVAASDLVVSGGGTMNREAAVLGVPAWSVFTGPTPYVDECLALEGRLRWVRTSAEYEEARSAPTPELLPRRGPYPSGLERIVQEVSQAIGGLPGEAVGEVEEAAHVFG
ncbi:MAG: DUF354 domain-containing protein [Candidatus Eiseniibacteriota bacterium]